MWVDVTPNEQRLSAARRCLDEALKSYAADKPCWTEPPSRMDGGGIGDWSVPCCRQGQIMLRDWAFGLPRCPLAARKMKAFAWMGHLTWCARQWNCAPARRTPASVDRRSTSRFKKGGKACVHGGPRLRADGIGSGAGNRACPCCSAITRKRPTWQHGQRRTSILATRAMNSCAHSCARGLTAGMCSARRAAASLTPLQADATTPKCRMRLMPVGSTCPMKRRTNSTPGRVSRRLAP